MEPFELVKAVQDKKMTENEVQCLQNRIKRLELEEERARKRILETQTKTKKMLEANKRHQEELKRREKLRNKKK